MSAFTAINLEKLPAPEVIERKDFEGILAELKAWLIGREPGLEPILSLESEPITKILEAWAYREMLLRVEFDDAARGNMLAFATGAQLDHLAAFYGVTRQIVQQADNSVIPPVPELTENDARLRLRVQLALEGFTTAGPRGSYVFWGLSASALVKDIGVESPAPGQVLVTVLGSEGDGLPTSDVLDAVTAQLNDEDVRPLTDQVTVQAATIIPYEVSALLTLYEGPDAEVVRQAALAAVTAYVSEHHRLGHDITISGLHAALHQPGVQKVTLTSPIADIVVATSEAAFCEPPTVEVGGRDV
ncbi:Baseplate J-like protein [Pelagimonas phthalicica]|uniref:Baseplate J-like protein n=1 Tax=Pelagimonas phthalicica TaxID=1037362 RepID=A0A238JA97_9RHOB|nr:baseplate J/gp47 family protein [Pelagimonas phthalicica]TDS94182.1 phage-related baseplate assembly protein [Pelagimonas phthalicica]SMX27293.1 Baseplate J-like protein [Pelagimonas phthalicica]